MQPALQPLPNGFLGLFLWGCSLFRNGSLCGQGQPEQDLPVPQPESRHIDLPEQGQVYVESLLIMRTALAASVAAVAKWISGAVSLRLQAAPERRQAYIESFLNIYKLLMRTALAASVAAVAKWTFVAAPLGL